MATRKLEQGSWLAQSVADMMQAEFEVNGISSRWLCLQVFFLVVSAADDPEDSNIRYERIPHPEGVKRGIVIRDIPSLISEEGSDFDREGMRSKLLGLAARYKDDEGRGLVSVLITHDLNSAKIVDVSELMYQLRKGC